MTRLDETQAASDHTPGSDKQRLTLKARLGMIILGVRSVALQLLYLGATVILARLLDPADFGVFAIVQFVLTLTLLFGDAGLGGALIQQKAAPTQTELSTVFWVHIAISAAVMVVIWTGAPLMMRFWSRLPPESPWLLRAISVSLCFSFMRAVPSMLMERDLQFGRLSLIEILNSVAFHVAVVVLAFLHFGVWALVIGVVFQSIVTLIATYVSRPWRPRWSFDRAVLRPMLRFGLAFQLKGVISFVSEAVTPIYAGALLGPARLGYLNWARDTAYYPLKLVEIIGRVSFPLYSRLRDDPVLLAAEIEKNVKICLVVTLFFVGMVFGIGSNLTSVVYGDKWLPALPALYTLALAISIGFISPIIGAAFDAIGEPQIFVRLSTMWTIVNWASVLLVTPLFPDRLKLAGYAIAYSVHVVVGNIAVIVVMRRKLPPVRFAGRAASSLAAAVTVAAFGRLALHAWATGVASFIAAVLASMAVFAAVLLAIDAGARDDLRALLRRRRPR